MRFDRKVMCNEYPIRIKGDIMRFAISIPQFVADGAFDPAGLRAYLARAEALGFERAPGHWSKSWARCPPWARSRR